MNESARWKFMTSTVYEIRLDHTISTLFLTTSNRTVSVG